MYNFIFKRQPKSYNGWKKTDAAGKLIYKNLIRSSFSSVYGSHSLLTHDLYGIVYHFYNRDTGNDADNLSKPLWDCLTGFLFIDDKQVKVRTAGSFDLSKNDISLLDFSGLPGAFVADLVDAFDTEEHVVYVECGTLNMTMYKFNIE